MCTISCDRRKASACRRAWMEPSRPSVIIFSATGRTAFAFVSVVRMRPCSISEAVRFAYSALRWAESRPSFFPARWWRMLGGQLLAAQRQAVRGQGLLDLLDRLLAEVRDRPELGLG